MSSAEPLLFTHLPAVGTKWVAQRILPTAGDAHALTVVAVIPPTVTGRSGETPGVVTFTLDAADGDADEPRRYRRPFLLVPPWPDDVPRRRAADPDPATPA